MSLPLNHNKRHTKRSHQEIMWYTWLPKKCTWAQFLYMILFYICSGFQPIWKNSSQNQNLPRVGVKIPKKYLKPAPTVDLSGQITIFHQPRFFWNKGDSLTKPPFWGPRSCEVALIWPDWFLRLPCSPSSGGKRTESSLTLACHTIAIALQPNPTCHGQRKHH